MCDFLPSSYHTPPPHFTGFRDVVPVKGTLEEKWKNPSNNLKKKKEETTDLKIQPFSHLSEASKWEVALVFVTVQPGCPEVVPESLLGFPHRSCHRIPCSPRSQLKSLMGRAGESGRPAWILVCLVTHYSALETLLRTCVCVFGVGEWVEIPVRGQLEGAGCTWGLVECVWH